MAPLNIFTGTLGHIHAVLLPWVRCDRCVSLVTGRPYLIQLAMRAYQEPLLPVPLCGQPYHLLQPLLVRPCCLHLQALQMLIAYVEVWKAWRQQALQLLVVYVEVVKAWWQQALQLLVADVEVLKAWLQQASQLLVAYVEVLKAWPQQALQLLVAYVEVLKAWWQQAVHGKVHVAGWWLVS